MASFQLGNGCADQCGSSNEHKKHHFLGGGATPGHSREHGSLTHKITGLFHKKKKKKNRQGRCHDGGSSSSCSSDSESDNECRHPRKGYY